MHPLHPLEVSSIKIFQYPELWMCIFCWYFLTGSSTSIWHISSPFSWNAVSRCWGTFSGVCLAIQSRTELQFQLARVMYMETYLYTPLYIDSINVYVKSHSSNAFVWTRTMFFHGFWSLLASIIFTLTGLFFWITSNAFLTFWVDSAEPRAELSFFKMKNGLSIRTCIPA